MAAWRDEPSRRLPWLGLLCLPLASAAAAALLLVFGEPTRADFAAGLLVLLSLASAVVITVCLARMVPSMFSRAGAACCLGAFGLLCLAPFVPDMAFYVGLISSWGIGMGLSLVSLLRRRA
ncbi:MAG: hypothetical protein ACJ786_27320 [Catenulispora sp.]